MDEATGCRYRYNEETKETEWLAADEGNEEVTSVHPQQHLESNEDNWITNQASLRPKKNSGKKKKRTSMPTGYIDGVWIERETIDGDLYFENGLTGETKEK